MATEAPKRIYLLSTDRDERRWADLFVKRLQEKPAIQELFSQGFELHVEPVERWKTWHLESYIETVAVVLVVTPFLVAQWTTLRKRSRPCSNAPGAPTSR